MIVASVTALDVALVSAIAALSAAIVAPAVAWVMAALRNRHERWLRIYDDRRDAYIAILREGYQSLDALQTFVESLEQNDPAASQSVSIERPEPRPAFQARVGLFAGRDVARELGDFEVHREKALRGLVAGDITTEAARAANVARVKPIIDDLEARLERIRKTLHDDIAKA